MTSFMPRLTLVVYTACFRSIFTFFSAATFSAWSTLGFMGSDRISEIFAFVAARAVLVFRFTGEVFRCDRRVIVNDLEALVFFWL